MNEGTTPLILAARHDNHRMVEELINAQADINAVDNKGELMTSYDDVITHDDT